MSISLNEPFVLLDNAGGDGRRDGRLFSAPVEVITVSTRADVAPALDRIAALAAEGFHLAGYLSYECGHAIEPRLATAIKEQTSATPLLWFGAFRTMERVRTDMLLEEVAARPIAVSPPVREIDAAAYSVAFERVQAFIAAGDIYQANLTFPARIEFTGHPLSLYARLRRTQRMQYGAVVWDGATWILSASPELFFTLDDGVLTSKPMKGTAPRRPSATDDDAAAAALASDPKNRAENLMITDLIRNDISRVSIPGSVSVSSAFAVERYPTVNQMTTTVRGELEPDRTAFDVLGALFPCGSVTGAPKIRAMEIIDAVEFRPRGVYTGSIGWISPSGDASFNVAIRTIVSARGKATMGIGSGIVADSDVDAEWAECEQKMAFVTETGRPFHLIETMAFGPDDGLPLLQDHMDRLARSAAYHGFALDRHAARNLLQAVVGTLRAPARVKLTLARDGAIAVACLPFPPRADSAVDVRVLDLPVSVNDVRLYHKTSDRAFYDDARREAGCFEVVFQRPDGRITEGSFSNVFIERGDVLLTPPVSDGLLSGVLRGSLIESGLAREESLTRADLADGFLLGNALRGLFPARLVDSRG